MVRGGSGLPEDSEWWSYWKKRLTEEQMQELKREIAELKRTIDMMEDSEDSVESEENEEE